MKTYSITIHDNNLNGKNYTGEFMAHSAQEAIDFSLAFYEEELNTFDVEIISLIKIT